jgi:hypothetical protein
MEAVTMSKKEFYSEIICSGRQVKGGAAGKILRGFYSTRPVRLGGCDVTGLPV